MGGWLSGLATLAAQAAPQENPEALVALFLVASLTEIGVPFPLVLDTLLFLLGYRVLDFWFPTLTVMLALLLGRGFGSAAVYWLCRTASLRLAGRFRNRLPGLRSVMERLAKKIGMQPSVATMLARLGAQAPTIATVSASTIRVSYTVALARITPGLLTATSVFFGTIGLRYRYFALGIVLASVLADGAIISLGAIMGYGLLQFGITPAPWLIALSAGVNILLIWFVSRLLWQHTAGSPASSRVEDECPPGAGVADSSPKN